MQGYTHRDVDVLGNILLSSHSLDLLCTLFFLFLSETEAATETLERLSLDLQGPRRQRTVQEKVRHFSGVCGYTRE